MPLLENSTVMCHQFKKIIFVSSIINLQWHFKNVFVKSAYLSKWKHSFHSELKALCRNDAPFFLLLRLNIDPFSKEIFNSCHESCVLGSWTFLKCIHCKQYFSSNTHTRTHCLTLTLPLTTCAVTYLSLAHITNWQKVFLKKSLANLRMVFFFLWMFYSASLSFPD